MLEAHEIAVGSRWKHKLFGSGAEMTVEEVGPQEVVLLRDDRRARVRLAPEQLQHHYDPVAAA